MPGRFETPGHSENQCACAVSESAEGEANMAAEHTGPTDRIIYVIYTFHRGEEGFNGVGSIKTDIYLTL